MFQLDEKVMSDNRTLVTIQANKSLIDRNTKNGTLHYSADTNDIYTTIPQSKVFGLYNRLIQESPNGKILNNLTFAGDILIEGAFTIKGTPTKVESINMEVTDNIVLLNKGETGNGVTLGSAGLQIERGLKDDIYILWDENESRDGINKGAFIFSTVNGSGIRNIKTWMYDTGDFKVAKDLYAQSIQASVNMSVTGELTVGGAVNLNSTLNVLNNSTFQNPVTMAKTLGVTGKVSLSDELAVTKNLSVLGTSLLSGAITASSSLSVNGTTTLKDILSVTGKTTLNDTLDVTKAAKLLSTLDVTGAVALTSILNVTGAATLSDALTVTGKTTLNNTLDVTLATSLKDTVSIEKTLTVTGITTLNDNVTATKDMSIGGILVTTGAATFNNILTVTQAATLNDILTVTGKATLNNALDVALAANLKDNAIIGKTLTVNGATVLNDNLTVAKDATIAGKLSVTGIVDFANTLTAKKDMYVQIGTESYKVLHSGDVTAGGSGTISVNADTIDEKHASDFSPSAVIDSTTPTANLQEGLLWFNPVTSQAKVYFGGKFMNIGETTVSLTTLTNNVVIDTPQSTIGIGISAFDKSIDTLLMFVNSVFEPSVNYTISEDNLTVTKGDGGTWDAETVFSFVCLTSANVYPDKLGISCIVSSYTAATDGETNLPINNSMYNKTFDTLHVYHEKTRLFEDIHYSINADGKSIDLIGWTLNTGEIIYYEVFKALRIASDITDGTLIQDGSISELKLDRQLSDKVNNIMVDEVTGTRYQLKMINGTLTIQAL